MKPINFTVMLLFSIVLFTSCQKEALQSVPPSKLSQQFAWVDNATFSYFNRQYVLDHMVQRNTSLTHYQEVVDDKAGKQSSNGYITKQSDTCWAALNKPIILIGNSILNNWGSAWLCFPNVPILNRAFGGSKYSQMMNYIDDNITPYNPRQVIIYQWENEVIQQNAASPATGRYIYDNAVKVISTIRGKLPNTRISIIKGQLRPKLDTMYHITNMDGTITTVRQKGSRPVMDEYNNLIAKYIATQPNMEMINLDKGMYNADGSPKESLYKLDKLHVTLEVYNMWVPQLKNYFVK